MDTLLNTLAAFLNSSAGFAVIWLIAIAMLILFMHRLSPFHKAWEKYEGAIITAIKLAEKDIPGTLPDAGLQRLEQALKYVIAAIAQQRPGPFIPSQRLVNALKEGIQIKHAELERLGNLRRAEPAVTGA